MKRMSWSFTSLRVVLAALLVSFTALAACGGEEGGDGNIDDDEVPPELSLFTVTGSAVDFATQQPVDGSATITVDGVVPAPSVTTSGAQFTIDGIPPASVFTMLTGSPPNYRNTYNKATEVLDRDVENITVEVVSEQYLTDLAAGFGVTPAAGTSILIARVVDDAGQPVEGVLAEEFLVNDATPLVGPFFLAPDRTPDNALMGTSSSGYAVFFDLTPEPLSITSSPQSTYSMTMPVSPAAAGVVTIADVRVIEGQVPLPMNVSFDDQIAPMFAQVLCTGCHAKNGEGRQDGGLSLKDNGNKLYTELTQELSPQYGVPRVNLDNPAESLILTKPGPPSGDHPNLTFASTDDPNYLLLLVWIQEGAMQN